MIGNCLKPLGKVLADMRKARAREHLWPISRLRLLGRLLLAGLSWHHGTSPYGGLGWIPAR